MAGFHAREHCCRREVVACSAEGRIRSIEARVISNDGLALSIDGRGSGGSSDDLFCVNTTPSLRV